MTVFHHAFCEDFKDGIQHVEDRYFSENNWYIYTYKSAVDSSFIGTTPSKSGFSLSCTVKLGIFPGFQSVLKVEDCKVFNRNEGDEDQYTEILSTQFSSDLSRYPLHFSFDKNEVVASSIQVQKDDPVYSVNIKRSILSSLQLQPIRMGEKHKTLEQIDMFGPCPVEYSVYDHAPGIIFTMRDLTLCKMPQLYTLQMRLFSVIKKLHGGYRQTQTLQPFYPFESTIDCHYKVSDSTIQSIECHQIQAFKPAAYNGSIYATAATNIRQSFSLLHVNPVLEDDKPVLPATEVHNAEFLYQFPEEETSLVTQKTIQDQLHALVQSYNDLDLRSWPELYQDFVWFLKHSTEENLQLIVTDILDCHGNDESSCDEDKKTLEIEYFVDGLLSCATEACISVFTKCVKDQHVSWFTSGYFLYDLALNHQPTEDSVQLVLDICKKSDVQTCWFPLSIMVNKMFEVSKDTTTSGQKDGPIFQAISGLHEALKVALQNGIDESKLVRILKSIGNMGTVVKDVYDVDGTLVNNILDLIDNRKVHTKVVKSAIQVFEKMELTKTIKEKLVLVTSDINRPVIIRTTAFSVLFTSTEPEDIQKILNLIHSEQMIYMQTYMVSFVEGMLENDQPDKQRLREAWQKALQTDGRELPVLEDYLYGKSRYMDLSRYFKLPLSVTHYGLQLEFDLVYDPASPLIQSAVLRLNYYKDEKYNLIELSADIKGLEELLDAVFDSKGKGLFSLVQLFTQVKTNVEKGVNPEFADFDRHLADALNKVVKLVNYPQFVIPDGMLTFKLYGYEVLYLDIQEVIGTVIANMGMMKQPPSKEAPQKGLMTKIMMMASKGYSLIKTRSSKMFDLTKVMPTLSGAPLNMTVLITTTMGLGVHAKADLRQFMNGSGPILANADLSLGFAGEFFGQMEIQMENVAKAGCRMITSLNAKGHLENTVTLKKEKEMKPVLANFTAHLKTQNTEGQYHIAKVRSRMYHLHDDWTEIPADSAVQKSGKNCTGPMAMLITGNTACLSYSYPDVADSKTHAYFPLSGPFTADLTLSRTDKMMDEFNIEMNYLIKIGNTGPKRIIDINYSAPGERLQRNVHIYSEKSLVTDSSTAYVQIPEMGVRLDATDEDVKHSDKNSTDTRSSYIKDLHLQMKGKTVFRAMLQVQKNITKETVFYAKEKTHVMGNRTHLENRIVLAVPGISLNVYFENLKEKLGTNINTKFNLKYYCSKLHPIMYLFHIQPKLAAVNNDTTEIEVVNNAVMGYSNGEERIWSSDDSLRISYPGQKFSFINGMVANHTNAHRKTIIVYTNSQGQQETITMNAHVQNETNQTSNHYCYHMTLDHKGKYDILLKGHLSGSLKKRLSLETDIHFKRKAVQVEDDVSSVMDVKNPTITEKKQCNIFRLEEWKMLINLTINAKPIFQSGQRIPKGVEFVWNLDVVYPGCGEKGQIRSEGAIGSHMKNTRKDFRYWIRKKTRFFSSKEVEPRIYDLNWNFEYLMRHYFDYELTYNAPGIETAYLIHSDRFPNNTGEIIVRCHLESDWTEANFDYEENYAIVYKGSEIDLESVIHDLTAEWSYFDIELSSELTKTDDSLSITQNGYIDMKYPIFEGITDISTQLTLSKTSRSGVNITLTRNETEYYIDMVMKSPRAIDTIFSIKKSEGRKLYVLSWLSELVGSTSRQCTIQWNPAFTRKGIAMLKAQKYKLSKALAMASLTITENINRSFTSMVIPFTNKTIGYVISKVALPVISYLPLPAGFMKTLASTMIPQSNEALKKLAHDDSYRENMQNDGKLVNRGEVFTGIITKFNARMLAMLSKMVTNPPSMITNLMMKNLKPQLYHIMKANKVSFIEPLIFKWKHFMTFPSFTIGQKYIHGLMKSSLNKDEHKSTESTALLYDRTEILTFDGKLYNLDGNSSSTCSHLLAADVKHGDFAVLSSEEGITLITKTSMITIHKGGQVFLNKCNIPIALPYQTKEFSIIQKKLSRVINLQHGFKISCDIKNDHCNFELKNYHNQTIGLLGNNDGEMGNDFISSNGLIYESIDKHISNFYVMHSESCSSPFTTTLSQIKACEDLKQKCLDLFTSLESPLAVCFLKVDTDSFAKSCLERVKSCMPHSICPSVHAYISKCDIEGIAIESSEKLDFCKDAYPATGELKSKALLDIIMVLYKDEGDSDFCLPCIETLVSFLQTCDTTDVKLTFTMFDSADSSLSDVLMKSTEHHFRLHTQKVVILIKENQDLSEAEYNTLRDVYLKENIVLNVVSKYSILKYKGLVGLDWDNRIISFDNILDETRELPHNFIIKLMSETKGALFNTMLLEKNRKTRLEGLVKHICERQAYSRTHCENGG